MAKKSSPDPAPTHGRHDIIGFILMGLAVLLLLALLSYDARDVRANAVPPNNPVRNSCGPIGAWVGYVCFSGAGVAAYLIPFALLFVGLACFVDALAFARRRWYWAVILLISCAGLLDLYKDYLTGIRARLFVTAGGILGMGFNEHLFNNFGTAGATVIYLMFDFISLLFLTNFHLGTLLRGGAIQPEKAAAPEPAGGMSEKEKSLLRRKRELEEQARLLEKEVEKAGSGVASGIGADLKPVPEPMVRDLSVAQAKPGADRNKKPVQPAPPKEIEPPEEGVVIPAKEVVAATTADILGRKPGEPVDVEKPAENPAAPGTEPLVVIAPAPKPKPVAKKPKPVTVASAPLIGNYQLPPLDFLQHPDLTAKPTESRDELMANARLMQQTLAQFDIDVSLGDITKGPTITRYELHPAPGVKLEKIAGLSNNIAAALKAERINILAPVPGKSSVGVEIPNAIKTKVIMRDLLESDEWVNSKARIPLALGKDVYGVPIVADLAEMPHLLIAGSTGSGKSVCINSIIASLLYKFSPDQLRFVMIDPKVVELQQYNVLPHLVVPVVTDPKKVILALRWVVNEMEKRYQIFARVGVRNIKSFNERPKNKPMPKAEPELALTAKKEKIEPGSDGFAVEVDEEIVVPREEDIVIPERLSYIVVIIDELADLMLVAPADVEMAIARITQMARAAGIHCIVATQRPSVDVITGVIKANIPARIAFQVAAKVDSRTILDAMGADKLLGKGDMLYLPPGSAKLNRVQGVLITDQEIQSMVDFIAKQGKPSYEVEIHKQLSKPVANLDNDGGSDEDEDLIQQCIEVIRSEQKASVSLMQRRLRLGYTRAARIMDELENRGIVGPSKGAEPRDILIDLDGGGADGNPVTSGGGGA